MSEIFITAIVFFGIYNAIKLLTDYLLRRKIIKSGHIDKAGILEPIQEPMPSGEVNKYPSLKWGLVALMSGIGLVIIETVQMNYPGERFEYEHSALPIGIELIFISLGFLIYFAIVNFSKKR
jgi:hypothetical protein